MVVLQNKKIIFVHIPRTGGISIYEQLTKFGRITNHKTHLTAYKLRRIVNNYNKCFSFAVVRNPFERMVSLYFYRKTSGKDGGVYGLGFKDWIKYIYSDRFDRSQTVHTLIDINFHLGTQLNWIVDRGGKIIVSKVLRFENLKKDWKYVTDILGKDVKLNLRNATNHKHYSCYYDSECIKLVEKNCKRDLDYFGYKFENNCDNT